MTIASELLKRDVGGDGQPALVRGPKLLELRDRRQAPPCVAPQGPLHIGWESSPPRPNRRDARHRHTDRQHDNRHEEGQDVDQVSPHQLIDDPQPSQQQRRRPNDDPIGEPPRPTRRLRGAVRWAGQRATAAVDLAGR
jgi:hypothetical protein